MIDLSKQSGLPVQWDPGKQSLVFDRQVYCSEENPDIRRRDDMEEVLFDRRACGFDELYYMYRGIALIQDRRAIADQGLRYDITVIRPGTLGGEFIKTAGHYHPLKPGTGLTFPEVYEVLHGRAHYLIQRPVPDDPSRLESVLLIAARPGDKVLIPPGYGHITINPGEDYLIMSNWVAEGFSSLYDQIRAHHGGAYYELQTEEGPEFWPNKQYQSLPPLLRCPVTPVPDFSLITGLPIYSVFQENHKAFRFLTHPELFRHVFNKYLSELQAGASS
jgi:glucose-6-phosphate isomerase